MTKHLTRKMEELRVRSNRLEEATRWVTGTALAILEVELRRNDASLAHLRIIHRRITYIS